ALKTNLALALVAVATTALARDGTIHRAKEHAKNSYIVMLYRDQPAGQIAAELQTRHGGKLTGVMPDLHGFSIEVPNEHVAEAIARDPRVAEVEEDAISHPIGCPRDLK